MCVIYFSNCSFLSIKIPSISKFQEKQKKIWVFFLQKEPSSKERSAGSATYNTYPDDLYLDDQDALEGSGRGGGEVRDDLEASGSGLGPDDEDGDDGHGKYSK